MKKAKEILKIPAPIECEPIIVEMGDIQKDVYSYIEKQSMDYIFHKYVLLNIVSYLKRDYYKNTRRRRGGSLRSPKNFSSVYFIYKLYYKLYFIYISFF